MTDNRPEVEELLPLPCVPFARVGDYAGPCASMLGQTEDAPLFTAEQVREAQRAAIAAHEARKSAQVEDDKRDAERYRKLRGWMSSNVTEGWKQVEQMAALCCYVSWDAMDETLDSLPECNVGLMQRAPVDATMQSTKETGQ